MKFHSVYIENNVKNRSSTRNIISRIEYKEMIFVRSYKDIIPALNFNKSISEQKKDLIIASNRGTFIKNCIRDKEHIKANEYFLYLFTGCLMDCQYCYLQDYLDTNAITVFINQKAFYDQLSSYLKTNKRMYFHAGEVCDPFMMERIMPYLQKLVSLFSNHQGVLLEIRSKTIPPTDFYSIKGSPNIIISYTLSPAIDIKLFEKKTSSLKSRLLSLSKCKDKGFSVGLRFDPVIFSPDMEEKYEALFNTVFEYIPSCKVSTVTLGALLFTRDLYQKIRGRYPKSSLLTGEFIQDSPYKIKYFSLIRKKMYKNLVDLLKKHIRHDFNKKVTFCMDKELENKILNRN